MLQRHQMAAYQCSQLKPRKTHSKPAAAAAAAAADAKTSQQRPCQPPSVDVQVLARSFALSLKASSFSSSAASHLLHLYRRLFVSHRRTKCVVRRTKDREIKTGCSFPNWEKKKSFVGDVEITLYPFLSERSAVYSRTDQSGQRRHTLEVQRLRAIFLSVASASYHHAASGRLSVHALPREPR